MSQLPAFDIRDVISIARKAGAEIMALRPSVIANPEIKGDGSPVTLADKRSSAIVIEGLEALTPSIPVISEENPEAQNRAIVEAHATYWIVDPLDGTQTYIDGHEGFGVHIGLIDNGVPAAGVVYFPAQGILYFTDGGKAYKQPDGKSVQQISVTSPESLRQPFSAATSWSKKRQPQSTLAQSIPAVGGGRACITAEGITDIALIEARFSYWDIAAAHALLRAAGGELFDLASGEAVRYPAHKLYIDPAIGGHAANVAKTRASLQAAVSQMPGRTRQPKP